MEKLLTFDEVLAVMRVTRPTLSRHFVAGDIPAIKFGRQWRVRESALNNFLNGGVVVDGQDKSEEPRTT